MFIIVYFVGMYWFVFVDVIIHIMKYRSESGFSHDLIFDSFLSKFGLDFSHQNGYEQTSTAMYFAMTSLSTIGFGDLHPVND